MKLPLCMSLAAALAAPLSAEWVKVSSPHVDLYTTAGDRLGREAVLFFEELRDSFSRLYPAIRVAGRVRVIAFRNAEEYEPFRLNRFSTAYYARDNGRHSIVMSRIDAETYPVALHEYSHLVMDHSGLRLPVWLNEGLAEVHSTMLRERNRIVLGRPSESRRRELASGRKLPLARVLGIGHDSAEYNQRDRAGIFYAQSWLLAHMLRLSPGYRERFPDFVRSISETGSAEESFGAVYGKSSGEVEADLRRYENLVDRNVIEVRLQGANWEAMPVAAAPAEVDGRLALADLYGFLKKPAEAERIFRAVEAEQPGAWRVDAARAAAADREGDSAAARVHYARAIEKGAAGPDVLLGYARLLGSSGVDAARRMEALERALEESPGLAEAHYLLGMDYFRARNYAGAVKHMRQAAPEVSPALAPAFFRALGYAEWRLGNGPEARAAALAAKKHAVDRDQVDAIARLMDEIERPAPRPSSEPPEEDETHITERVAAPRAAADPPALAIPRKEDFRRAAGHLIHFACEKQPRLTIQSATERIVVLVTDPGMVTMKGAGSPTFDFGCGRQQPRPVVVEYVERGGEKIVRSIEFVSR